MKLRGQEACFESNTGRLRDGLPVLSYSSFVGLCGSVIIENILLRNQASATGHVKRREDISLIKPIGKKIKAIRVGVSVTFLPLKRSFHDDVQIAGARGSIPRHGINFFTFAEELCNKWRILMLL